MKIGDNAQKCLSWSKLNFLTKNENPVIFLICKKMQKGSKWHIQISNFLTKRSKSRAVFCKIFAGYQLNNIISQKEVRYLPFYWTPKWRSYVMRPVRQKHHKSRSALRVLLIFCAIIANNIIRNWRSSNFEKVLVPDYKGLSVF